jgi:integrase/recombinase XerC
MRLHLEDVKGERVKPYRDTTGISKEAYKKMLAVPDRNTLKGKRDYALLRLLWDNALRRSEISLASIKDLDLDGERSAFGIAPHPGEGEGEPEGSRQLE